MELCGARYSRRSPGMRSVRNLLSILILVCLKGFAPGDESRLDLVLQTGHSYRVHGVALSGDGKLVVTAGGLDAKAILWHAASGKVLQHFEGHTGEVTSVALSGD